MNDIGIIGLGFVGTAVAEGMKHAFNVHGYDLKLGLKKLYKHGSWAMLNHSNPHEYIVSNVDGPIFICLPTPMNPDGSCNTSIVESAIRSLNEAAAQLKKDGQVVVIKSTVIPGTTARMNHLFKNVHVVFNPEFLRERSFVEDFRNQDRIIIGGPHEGTAQVKLMYEMAYPNVPVTKTSSTIAEMVKYITNCFLATKVSFANEIAQLCAKLNVDYDKVIEYATKDKRLGTSHWAVPGPDGKKGFSGSCFPKDLNAMMKLFESLGIECPTMKGAWSTNLKVRPEKDWEQLKGRAVTDPCES
jgi:UDPglucose 6-dehydrogenase